MRIQLWLVVWSFAATLAVGTEVPPGGVEMAPPGGGAAMSAWGGLHREVVAVTNMPFAKALRITNQKRPDRPWNAGAVATVKLPAQTGDRVVAAVWLRGATTDPAKGEATLSVCYESAKDSSTAPLRQTFHVGREWKEYFFPTMVNRCFQEGEGRFTIHTGFDPQTIEIGGVRLLNYGPKMDLRELPFTAFSYPGREPNAPWRKAAAERIEKIRKGQLTVRVVDANGRPAPAAQVEVRMKRHAFGFGTAISVHEIDRNSPDSERYREVLAKYFNIATTENGLRWSNWVPDNPWNRQNTGAAVDWLNAHGIGVRGHNMLWGPMDGHGQPKDYRGHCDELRRDLFAHLEKMTEWCGNRFVEWDAVNHPIGWGARTLGEECGVALYADVIRRARQLQPKAEIWINEENVDPSTVEKYLVVTKELVKQGARLDGAGFMGHYNGSLLPSPDEAYRLGEEFSKVVPQVQFTEFDVTCGSDDQLQADFLRDMLTMSFSHPAYKNFVMWGFWEDAHWIPSAALWRHDWTMKPAAKVWEDLVCRQWWTNVGGVTDATGSFTTHGFLGDYEVRAELNGRAATATTRLLRQGTTVVIQIP